MKDGNPQRLQSLEIARMTTFPQYLVENHKKLGNLTIRGIQPLNMFRPLAEFDILPPVTSVQLGRIGKRKRKESGGKASNKKKTTAKSVRTCKKCGEEGHNRATCTAAVPEANAYVTN